MKPNNFDVALRLWHPVISPSEITNVLAMFPSTSWAVGDTFQTATEFKTRRESYWTADLPQGPQEDLVQVLENSLDHLEDKVPFLRQFRSTGGRCEYFVSLYVDTHYGKILDYDLLNHMARSGIDLALDIYARKSIPAAR